MRKLTRTEANFENLLEAALLIEGHCSHAKRRGCCCRECDECEKNYMMEYGEDNEEGDDYEPTLADLVAELENKPKNTEVRYGDDPEADKPKYNKIPKKPNEENEARRIEHIAKVVNTGVSLPTKQELEKKGGGILGFGVDPVIKRIKELRGEVEGQLTGIITRLRAGGGVY